MNLLRLDKHELEYLITSIKKDCKHNHINIACEPDQIEDFRKLLTEEGYKFYLPEYKYLPAGHVPYATIYFKERMK